MIHYEFFFLYIHFLQYGSVKKYLMYCRFRVGLSTGQVTVAPCLTPGRGNCLDAEQTSVYSLTFMSTDRFGEGFSVVVPLTITVTDQNDNPPIFTVPNIVSFITEGKTEPDPKVQVQATDADKMDPIRYSIVGGNSDLLWQIGPETGVITATRPVDYEAIPGNTGRYILTVEATDGLNTVTGQVTINVIDTNDHAPVFDAPNYFQEISELTPPGTFIDQVQATDQDPSTLPSGQIQYRISQGGQDKFSLNASTGDITVSTGATFDYDVQNRYEMRVVAADQGSPQKMATATVVILIRDANNKNPFFQPSTVRESVSEDAALNTPVVRMNATDPDRTSSLVYFLEEPINGYSPTNQLVDPQQFDFKTMFSIERLTGLVKVNKTLAYDSVARYQAVVKARDNAGSTDQTATATLIITILQVNKRPPVFGEPWSPSNPVISITVNEGQPPSTYVTTLVATDPTDAIQEFRIISDPGNNFNIDPNTGTVTIRTELDYEKQQSVRFTVIAVDNGQPPMTATATVLVNIDNINDETPVFTQSVYNVDLPENSPNGTLVVLISATDADLGDFGVVRYSLDDPLQRFTIDPISGRLTVRDGSLLDREENATITLTVTAYDSPNNPDTRRYAQVPVYIKLVDVNDNAPTFPQQEYIAVILENVPNRTTVVQVVANDRDAVGPNSRLTYYKMNGDPFNLFLINLESGLIVTNGSLIGFSGTYNLTIGARDNGSPVPLSGTTRVRIQVLQANNGPPLWINPRTTNSTVSVVEETYKGEEIIDVHAEDRDPGKNGEVEYGFSYQNQFVSETPEFQINPNTGQITAKVEFDRERKDSYTLLLVARDKGEPPYSSEIFLFIKILDVNDNKPEFPQFANCCSIPGNVSVYEDIAVNTDIGNVTAYDRDLGRNAEIVYSIIGGNVNDAFKMDPWSGQIRTNQPLDHERQNFYNLTVQAVDRNGADVSSVVAPQCRCSDPSLIFVYIHVLDRNDFPPVFARTRYHSCVPLQAELGKQVAMMEAIDNDSKSSRGVSYTVTNLANYNSRDGNDQRRAQNNSFLIGRDNGSVVTNALMTEYENHYFVLDVLASDIDLKSSLTQLYIWVTTSDQEITMTFDRPPEEVQKDLDAIMLRISALTGNGIVCVSDLTYHVSSSNLIDRTQTDLTFHVINNSTFVIIPPVDVIPVLDGQFAAFGVVAIVASYSYWDGFIIDPVLAAVIIIFILLLIALLLLCCLCWCLAAVFGKKTTYAYAEKPLYMGTINPLWGHKFYEDQELNMAVKENETIEATPGALNKAFVGDVPDAAHKREETHFRETTSYNYESSNMMTAANGHVGTSVRIEAPLEGSRDRFSGMGNGVYSGGSHLAHTNIISTATMTDDERSEIASSKAPSRVGFGATLTRPDHQQERVISERTGSDFGEYHHHSVSNAGSTRYTLYTGPRSTSSGPPQISPPIVQSGQYTTLLSTEEMGHPSGDVFSSQGFIDQLDGSMYQGEIRVPANRSQEYTTSYVETRGSRTVLN